jgi:hypothetical protein
MLLQIASSTAHENRDTRFYSFANVFTTIVAQSCFDPGERCWLAARRTRKSWGMLVLSTMLAIEGY